MPSPIAIKRLLLTLPLAGGLALTGFTVGGLLAASLLVSPADGLAGGATVTAVALAGGLSGVTVGIVLGWKLRPARLVPMACLAVACALAAIALAVWRSGERRRARAAEAVSPRGSVRAAAALLPVTVGGRWVGPAASP